MEIKGDLQYSKEHEWVSKEGSVITIGITDFAQNSLGDIVYVELPEVGLQVDTGEAIGSIESVKAVSDLFCPIEGEIVEINKQLEEEPELLNSDPYKKGWIFKVKSNPGALSQADLMDDDEYASFTEED